MKVYTSNKPHALDTIHATGSKPMQKTPLRIETRDDRMVGAMLAAEVMAEAKGGQSKWRGFALRLIDATVEARAVFMNQIKAEKGAMTKAQVDHGIDDKYSKATTASLSVEVSKLQTIAKAFNGPATVEGWMAHVNSMQRDTTKHCDTIEELRAHAGYETLVQYARTFSKSTAGRKADNLAVKLAKFLKNNAPDQDADANDVSLFDALVVISNKVNA